MIMSHKVTLLLVVVSCVCQASGWGFGSKPHNAARNSAPHFAVVPSDSRALGKGQLAVLEGEAAKETFLDRLLGTNCYARAVAELGAECRSMGQDQKSRLALRLVNCQLATQGHPTHPCGPAQPLRQCTDALPDRAYHLYVEFLSHADNMCLFIQNQNFEKYTEGMLNKLAEHSAYARDQLAALGEQAAERHAHITRQAQDFAARAEESLELGREARGVQQELLATARGHREESLAYYTSLTTHSKEIISLQGDALRQAGELREGQAGMARALEAGAARVEGLFSLIDGHAERQVALLGQHEAQQRQLTSELRDLAADTQGLRAAVDVVVRYEQRSDAALIKLLGRSYTLEDAAFYGTGLLAVAATGAVPPAARARLPVLALLCSSLVGERLVLQRLHLLLERDPADELVVHLPLHLLPLPGPLRHLGAGGPLAFNVKWALRKALAGLAALMVLYTVASHRNYERDGFNALRRMEAQTCARSREQLERLARIEQRLAALQAWERQRQLRQALEAQQAQVAAAPAHGPQRGGPRAAAVAARLLPPGLLQEGAGAADWAEGGSWGDTDEGRGAAESGWLLADGGREEEEEQQQQQQQQAPLAAAGGHRQQATPSKANPAAVAGTGQAGARGGDAGADRGSRREPQTPAPRRTPAGGSGRKRRGSEETQETAATEETGGRKRADVRGLGAEAGQSQELALQGQAKRRMRGPEGGAGEGGRAKRSRC